MAFTRTMTVKAPSAEPLAELPREWHRDQHGAAERLQAVAEGPPDYRDYVVAFATG